MKSKTHPKFFLFGFSFFASIVGGLLFLWSRTTHENETALVVLENKNAKRLPTAIDPIDLRGIDLACRSENADVAWKNIKNIEFVREINFIKKSESYYFKTHDLNRTLQISQDLASHLDSRTLLYSVSVSHLQTKTQSRSLPVFLEDEKNEFLSQDLLLARVMNDETYKRILVLPHQALMSEEIFTSSDEKNIKIIRDGILVDLAVEIPQSLDVSQAFTKLACSYGQQCYCN